MSTSDSVSSSTSADVAALINDIIENPDKPNELDQKAIMALQAKMNLYGIVIPAERQFANMSITNIRDRYFRRFTMTALVGMMFQSHAEYSFDDEPCAELLEFVPPEKASEFKAVLAKHSKQATQGFLKRNFQFDPNRHVQSSYSENADDPDRMPKRQAARTNMMFADCTPDKLDINALMSDFDSLSESLPIEATVASESFRQDLRAALDNADETLHAAFQHAGDVQSIAAKATKHVVDSDSRVALAKYHAQLTDLCKDIYSTNPSSARLAGAYEWEVPADLYSNFDRYITNNYSQLRSAVDVLYAEKPDIDFAIQFYGSFATEEEARKHQRKHESSVIAPIFTVANEQWTLLGPFKENQERVSFYTKNTEIIQKLFAQAEMDERLGADMMKKRVVAAKTANIAAEGPDAEGLGAYRKAMTSIETLGAKKGLSAAEETELSEAKRVKEMAEVPTDAIQVDTFHTNAEGKLVKGKFYTQAETPEFMEDNLKSQERAYGNRGELKDSTTASKRVVSRSGVSTAIAELKNNIKPADA